MRTLPIASLVVAALQISAVARPAFAQSATPGMAPAAPAGGDVIHLKNGGQLRGTIVDVIPGDHARIQLATGEVANVPWADIARVDSGSHPSPTPDAPRPSAPVAQKLVHIDAPREVSLERQVAGTKTWVEVCRAPCDQRVPASGNYRIGGSGVRASRTFVIDAGTDDRVFIEVDPSSKGWFVGGIVLTSVGGLTTIIGLFVALIGAAASDLSKQDNSLTAGGLTVAGVGAVATVAGVVALVSNSKSGATVSSTPPPAGGGEASRRTPTWATATPSGAASPVVLPMFTTTF